MDASLVMRDRETDSWWSIMTSDAIGGELDGVELVEFPRGEKVTWKDWRRRHPDTLVLSVDGEEHIENNPYDNYFDSEGTFRDLEIDDHRLAPKDSIYSFWRDDEPYAVPHTAFAGGKVLEVEGWGDQRLFLYRGKKAAIFESSRGLDRSGIPGRTRPSKRGISWRWRRAGEAVEPKAHRIRHLLVQLGLGQRDTHLIR